MKIVFISSYFNHHQSDLGRALHELTNGKFSFVETKEIGKERIALGYSTDNKAEYVFSFNRESKLCMGIIEEADVYIIGSAPNELTQKCISSGKPVFRYSERVLKNGLEPFKYIPRLIRWRLRNPRDKQIFLLCASAYVSSDYHKFGLFKGKSFKWGYFPPLKLYASIDEVIHNKRECQILWVGRFIDWKHPDHAAVAASILKKQGYSFKLHMIGCGNELENVKALTKKLGVADSVIFHGSMSPEAVRELMVESAIFIQTSDRGEGWGAVINEAMNSGCAVISSHSVGAAPYLLVPNCGILYESGNIVMLAEAMKCLLDDPSKAKKFGRNAYQNIVAQWNAQIAAERFIDLASAIIDKRPLPNYTDGPCSCAPLYSDKFSFEAGII